MNPDKAAVREYLSELQDSITTAIEQLDGGGHFQSDLWVRPGGGGGDSRVLKSGRIFEQAGVGFSHVMGEGLPPSATQGRPDLAGASFEAMGVSLVFHPTNPFIPTTHMNVRFFIAEKAGQPPVCIGTKQPTMPAPPLVKTYIKIIRAGVMSTFISNTVKKLAVLVASFLMT